MLLIFEKVIFRHVEYFKVLEFIELITKEPIHLRLQKIPILERNVLSQMNVSFSYPVSARALYLLPVYAPSIGHVIWQTFRVPDQ